ncbi:DNA repair protein RadC [Candidatus Xenohaliotis californiensis]|uniref:DNA repair protein RadC n=1 Tax=Candidatus Xenohaliotis californiensis TaxID=84677 RepID=A0ABP0EV17_9RICK|nr:DNA repair protein RadC [Candidatus Xenohaliotis californiensis]
MHIGHRKRLRNRLLNSGGIALEDYELLELLLFNALPRRDTKLIAKQLLKDKKSLRDLFTQSEVNDLMISGYSSVVQASIICVAEIVKRVISGSLKKYSVFNNWRQIMDYLIIVIGNKDIECFYVMLLGSGNKLIAEDYYTGTVSKVMIYYREVLKKAISLNAVGIIVAHNHPSGSVDPSKEDIESTKALVKMCQVLEIKVLDHVIVSGNKFFSFSAVGLL